MTDRPKLLWHSGAPWSATGYGAQTALFAPLLAEDYDLAISAFWGLEDSRLVWNGIPVLPGAPNDYGDKAILPHARSHFGDPTGGLVITLLDVWVLDAKLWKHLNVASWVPVDHDPVPARVTHFFKGSGAIPIAMSRFGQERLEDALYVPHGVPTDVFKPRPKDEARKLLGFPQDAFLVGVVAANIADNPSRKAWPQILQAFKAFRERHDDAVLYLHTEIRGKHAGVNIPALMANLEIPGESVRFTDQYRYEFDPFPPDALAQMYSSMDVLLNPSMGEGFGIPIMEAQSCGVPAVVTDFSAMKEVCGSGWHVGGTPYWTRQDSWQTLPSVEEVIEALEECYALSDKERKQYSERARAHAKPYDCRLVVDNYWRPALKEIEERMSHRPPSAEPWLPLPKGGELALDVGANVGDWTRELLKSYKAVHAFEPNPDALAELRANVGDGPQIMGAAVGAGSGELTLKLYGHHSHTSAFDDDTLDTQTRGKATGEITVPLVSLDELGYAGSQVDFVKIDVEGYEAEVILGALQTLQASKPQLLVEIHSAENGETVNKLLTDLGYEPKRIPHPHAGVPAGHHWITADAPGT